MPDDQGGGHVHAQRRGEGPSFAASPDGHRGPGAAGHRDGGSRPKLFPFVPECRFQSQHDRQDARHADPDGGHADQALRRSRGVGRGSQRRNPPGGRHDQQGIDGPTEHQRAIAPDGVDVQVPSRAANHGSYRPTGRARPCRTGRPRGDATGLGVAKPPTATPARSIPRALRPPRSTFAKQAGRKRGRASAMPSTRTLAMMAMPICTLISPRDQVPSPADAALPEGECSRHTSSRFRPIEPHDGPNGGRDGKELDQRGEECRVERPLGQGGVQCIAQHDGHLQHQARGKGVARRALSQRIADQRPDHQRQRHEIRPRRPEGLEERLGDGSRRRRSADLQHGGHDGNRQHGQDHGRQQYASRAPAAPVMSDVLRTARSRRTARREASRHAVCQVRLVPKRRSSRRRSRWPGSTSTPRRRPGPWRTGRRSGMAAWRPAAARRPVRRSATFPKASRRALRPAPPGGSMRLGQRRRERRQARPARRRRGQVRAALRQACKRRPPTTASRPRHGGCTSRR